jgi:DNA-binding NtrC family response regulator
VSAAPPREPLVLVVDDDAGSRKAMALTLATDGRRVEEFGDADSALSRAMDDPSVGLVVTDLKMPGKTGIELASELAAARPDVSVLLVTAFGDIDTLLKAKDLGTVDYVAKPVARDDLRLRASAALGRARQAGEIKQLRERLDKRYGFEAIIGVSAAMERVFDVLRKVAPTRMNVLITGESGTGKELVANALHHNSPRRPRAFVALNCGAIPKEIIESELFGHEKGAFTGALVKRMGRIEQAHGGTLFLDEVSEMPPDLQVKFLRVLEERRVTPVGGNDSKESDFRLVSATNRDLKKGIEAGRFRQDLYYRLKGVVVDLPALRERRDDVPLLAERFRDVFAKEHEREVTGFTPAALSALMSYAWPGNVREMKSAIEWAVFSAAGPRIDVCDLPPDVKGDAEGEGPRAERELSSTPSQILVGKTMAEIEKEAILTALQASGGNRRKAAERLEIGLRTLQRKLKEYRGETGAEEGEDDGDDDGQEPSD